jgi:hypothetical protein
MVQAGTLFGYLAAFITIVLGLALADMLVSIHRLLRARRRVVWRPLPLLLALVIGLSLLTAFFELWDMTGWERISYYGLVWQVVNYVPIFLAACAVLPDDVPPEGLDLDQFYFEERRYIVALVALGLAFDVGHQIVAGWSEVVADPGSFFFPYLVFNLLFFSAFAAIAWSGRKWVHWIAYAVLLAVAHIGYSMWDISGGSAMTGNGAG